MRIELTRRAWPMRQAAAVAALCIAALAGPLSAGASNLKGYIDYTSSAPIDLTIQGDEVTALSGLVPDVPCTARFNVSEGLRVALRTPTILKIVKGHLVAAGSADAGPANSAQWSITATVNRDLVATGSVTVTGTYGTQADPCSAKYPFTAVAVPSERTSPALPLYGATSNAHATGTVSFDVRHGEIEHLTAQGLVDCAGMVLDGNLDTVSYRLDPIRLSHGRFHVVSWVINKDGGIAKVAVSGTVGLHRAQGTIATTVGTLVDFHPTVCTGHQKWLAINRATYRPPPHAPSADWSADPVMELRTDGRLYYFLDVNAQHCFGGVTAIRFTLVGWGSRDVDCGNDVMLGPVTPDRYYRLEIRWLGPKKSPAIPDETYYIPGGWYIPQG